MTDYLSKILARTRRENLRRRKHVKSMRPLRRAPEPARAERGIEALCRQGPPRVIAEVKFRSPSAGVIRTWTPGEGVRVASAYERGGASVVSVLADAPDFGGSPLLVRRITKAISVPVLFKGFVIDPVQVDLAFDVGASLVLLLVRALSDKSLESLITHARVLGVEPVVEAADAEEVDRAIASGATIIGVNARDLQTFRVDLGVAHEGVSRIPAGRVAVFMSGVRSDDDFMQVSQSRADAVLIGEGLMRTEDPGGRLSALLRSV